jgi:hypothetical protein
MEIIIHHILISNMFSPQLRTVAATLVLYLCCLALTGLQPPGAQGRGKPGFDPGKLKIRVVSSSLTIL